MTSSLDTQSDRQGSGPPAASGRDALAQARAWFESGATRSQNWRTAQLEGLLTMFDRHRREMERALASDLGKPPTEGWMTDIAASQTEIQHVLRHLGRWMKPQRVRMSLAAQPGRARIVREPLGVALVVAPWNYPIQLLVNPLAAALAGGNTVVAKPSELSPACSTLLADLLPRYVDGVVVVEGGADVAAELTALAFDHIFFTGSTAVGKLVMRAAADNLTPVTLELGGKSPAIFDQSFDLESAAQRLTWGKFLNAGQTCIAPDYVLVPTNRRDELVDEVVATVGRFYSADPQASPDYGRIVNERHLQRLRGLLQDHGGTIAAGGGFDESDRYLEPTVVVDPSPDSALMAEEIFGPILPVLSVDSLDEAIDFVTARPKPLALYAFGQDDDALGRIEAETSAGGMCINHALMHFAVAELPFGGVGDAGMGRYHGQAGFDTFTNPKAVLRKPNRPEVTVAYPPYTNLKRRLLKRLL